MSNAKTLAGCLLDHGYTVLTGGSDNHMLLVNVLDKGITGVIAERALEDCGIIINKNKIPGDKKSPQVASGIRLGTNNLSARKMREPEMQQCTDLIHTVLSTMRPINDTEYELNSSVREFAQAEVKRLCDLFPIPDYPIYNGK